MVIFDLELFTPGLVKIGKVQSMQGALLYEVMKDKLCTLMLRGNNRGKGKPTWCFKKFSPVTFWVQVNLIQLDDLTFTILKKRFIIATVKRSLYELLMYVWGAQSTRHWGCMYSLLERLEQWLKPTMYTKLRKQIWSNPCNYMAKLIPMVCLFQHSQDNFEILGTRVNMEYSRHRKLQTEPRDTRSAEDRDWVCFKVGWRADSLLPYIHT